MKTRLTRSGTPLLAVATMVLVGCAGAQPPNEQMAVTQAAVARAEQAQAYQFAPVAFNAAQEKLSQARVEMERRNFEAARQLAEKAEVDAELAYFTARSTQSQQVVEQLRESIQTLQRELETGT